MVRQGPAYAKTPSAIASIAPSTTRKSPARGRSIGFSCPREGAPISPLPRPPSLERSPNRSSPTADSMASRARARSSAAGSARPRICPHADASTCCGRANTNSSH
jgi:hypothetical protein